MGDEECHRRGRLIASATAHVCASRMASSVRCLVFFNIRDKHGLYTREEWRRPMCKLVWCEASTACAYAVLFGVNFGASKCLSRAGLVIYLLFA